MTAKVVDVVARPPGCAGQAADAVSAYSQVKMEDAPKLLKLPKSKCPDIWIRLPRHKWPKSWSSMEDPVVPLERKSVWSPIGRIAVGKTIWKSSAGTWMGKSTELGMLLRASNARSYSYRFYVDEKKADRKHNLDLVWKKIDETVCSGRTKHHFLTICTWGLYRLLQWIGIFSSRIKFVGLEPCLGTYEMRVAPRCSWRFGGHWAGLQRTRYLQENTHLFKIAGKMVNVSHAINPIHWNEKKLDIACFRNVLKTTRFKPNFVPPTWVFWNDFSGGLDIAFLPLLFHPYLLGNLTCVRVTALCPVWWSCAVIVLCVFCGCCVSIVVCSMWMSCS